jgi:hypothetical protein
MVQAETNVGEVSLPLVGCSGCWTALDVIGGEHTSTSVSTPRQV